MDFTREVFINNHNDIIKQANDSKSINSIKVIRNRQLYQSKGIINSKFHGFSQPNFWKWRRKLKLLTNLK